MTVSSALSGQMYSAFGDNPCDTRVSSLDPARHILHWLVISDTVHLHMIKSFNHKGLKRLYQQDEAKLIPPSMLATVREILSLLENADTLEALNLPGYRLHTPKPVSKHDYAMDVTGNWRIIFRFEQGDAFDVELIDYH